MDEKDVLTNRQLGFELKAANNMIRRKMEAILPSRMVMNLTECRDRFWDICIIRAGTVMYIRRMWSGSSGSADLRRR